MNDFTIRDLHSNFEYHIGMDVEISEFLALINSAVIRYRTTHSMPKFLLVEKITPILDEEMCVDETQPLVGQEAVWKNIVMNYALCEYYSTSREDDPQKVEYYTTLASNTAEGYAWDMSTEGYADGTAIAVGFDEVYTVLEGAYIYDTDKISDNL